MFTVLTRDLTDLLRNPRAFVGGLAGSTMCMAGLLGLTMLPPADRDGGDEQDDELQMEFLAGALVRRGEKPPEDPIPVKVIVDATHAVDVPPDTTVTTNQDAPPAPPKPPPTPDKPKVPSKDPADPNKPGKPGTHTTPGNNTHNDHPTADQLPGDPFGSPDGWSDMSKDGDPWATAVLAALNNLTVGSYAGLGQDVTYKFQIIVCADGTIDDVRTKQSSGKSDFDGQMRNAIERIKLPKAPADIAKQLAGSCKKIPYIFTWAGKGKVQ